MFANFRRLPTQMVSEQAYLCLTSPVPVQVRSSPSVPAHLVPRGHLADIKEVQPARMRGERKPTRSGEPGVGGSLTPQEDT
jgi:hypothetical protein